MYHCGLLQFLRVLVNPEGLHVVVHFMKVRYLDGLSSVEHSADLDIGVSGLRIHYVDALGSLQEVYWAAGTLAPSLVEYGKPVLLRRKGQLTPYVRFDTDVDFNRVVVAYPNQPLVLGRQVANQFTNSGQTGRIVALVGLAMVVIALVGYVIVDNFGQMATAVLPISWDIKAGKTIYNQMESQGQITPNTQASAIAQRFFEEAGFKSRFPIVIHVDKTQVVNAFALPGGQIILNEGLIGRASKPEELAGVLAHEMGHVERRHTFQHLARTGVVYFAVSVLAGDLSGILAVLVENGSAIFNLTYNRKMEEEADDFAVNQLLRHEIDPEGLPSFFKILEEEEEESGADKIPQLFKTHPATPERIANIEASIPNDYDVDDERHEKLEALFTQLQGLVGNEETEVDDDSTDEGEGIHIEVEEVE